MTYKLKNKRARSVQGLHRDVAVLEGREKAVEKERTNQTNPKAFFTFTLVEKQRGLRSSHHPHSSKA